MPKLPDQWINFRTDDDARFSEKVTCSVTTTGEFSIGVPRALLDIAFKRINSYATNKDGVAFKSQAGTDRILGHALAHCINFLRDCAEDYLKAEETRDRVIVYKVQVEASAWIDHKGRLWSSGGLDEVEGGQWWHPHIGRELHATNRAPFYCVGLAARVFDRVTLTRSSGKTEIWEYVRDSKDVEIDTLNGFTGLNLDPDEHDYKVMPYTPAAARFFINMMLGICNLAMNIDDFFSDEKRLQAAIKNPRLTGQLFLTNKPIMPIGHGGSQK
jgi:hypothetical protein